MLRPALELSDIEELGVFTLDGSVTINGNPVAANELAVMSESERNLEITCTSDSEVLILGGPEIRMISFATGHSWPIALSKCRRQ